MNKSKLDLCLSNLLINVFIEYFMGILEGSLNYNISYILIYLTQMAMTMRTMFGNVVVVLLRYGNRDFVFFFSVKILEDHNFKIIISRSKLQDQISINFHLLLTIFFVWIID